MKKLVLLGVVVALSTGCGRGWLPIFRGAPCNSGVCNAPALPASYGNGCAQCAAGANYGDYQDEVSQQGVISSDSGYYPGAITDGQIIDGGYPSSGNIVSPSMAPVTQPAN